MTDLLEVSGPSSLAALVSALAPGQPRPLGRLASFWLDDSSVFALAQFDAGDDWPFLISVQPSSLAVDSDVRRQSKRMTHRLRISGWDVRRARLDDRAIA